MTFQPDIMISWDISEKDYPTLVISLLEYNSTIKQVCADVLCRIDLSEDNAGAISMNQLIAKHHLYKSNKLKEEAEAALKAMQEGGNNAENEKNKY